MNLATMLHNVHSEGEEEEGSIHQKHRLMMLQIGSKGISCWSLAFNQAHTCVWSLVRHPIIQYDDLVHHRFDLSRDRYYVLLVPEIRRIFLLIYEIIGMAMMYCFDMDMYYLCPYGLASVKQWFLELGRETCIG